MACRQVIPMGQSRPVGNARQVPEYVHPLTAHLHRSSFSALTPRCLLSQSMQLRLKNLNCDLEVTD
ncbi:hypothetical protein J6590_050280 [Homalodisca vitripennis]|nr:hypothetical protein J6590_050280 [Homalodisca vitripennis]